MSRQTLFLNIAMTTKSLRTIILTLFMFIALIAVGQTAIPTTPNSVLQDGVVYTVSSNTTITATTPGQSGLQVAQGAKVVINIKAGVTLTVTGANADASKGFAGMPGILVPETSTLVVIGEGKLVAKGGNASNGLAGENGEDAGGRPAGVTLDNSNRRFTYTYSAEFPNYGGYGGAGGDGGYGAGAGIGGAGGHGGKGGIQRERGAINIQYSGLEGNAGGAATQSGGMGKVYILGNVDASNTTLTVTSTAGNAGSAGAAGTNGYYGYTTSKANNRYYSIGGGGAGAGGVAGSKPTYSIGAGGAAGGGGGSGGQGGADYSSSFELTYSGGFLSSAMNQQNASCEGGPGTGGKSADDKRDAGRGKTTLIFWGSYTQTGGAGGAAGTNGILGSQGDLYILGPNNSTQSNAYKRINNSTSKPASNTTTFTASTLASTYSEIVALYQIKLSFNNQGGSTARAALTMIKGDAITSLTNFTIPTKDGCYFDGYYTEAEGGERIFDHNGKVVDATRTFTSDKTLYAHWISNQFTVTWDYSYVNQNGNLQELNSTDKSKYAKVQFNVGNAFITTASTEKNGTGNFSGHKIATATITANVGTGTNNATTIYVTEDQLRTLQISATALSGNNISATDNKYISTNNSAHEVVLSAIPAGTYMQPWNITILNEKKPEVLHVKLLRSDSEDGTYEVINQHTAAFACANKSGVYEGTYPVWPQSALNADLYYKVQIVGYEADGVMHNVASMPLTTDVSSNASQITITQEIALPIVRFDLNAPTSTTPHYASGTTEYKYATTYGEIINLSSYSAELSDNRFNGWGLTDDAKKEEIITSVTANGETTVYASWSDAIPPVINFTGSNLNQEEDEDGYFHGSLDVYVHIEDANDGTETTQWYHVANNNKIQSLPDDQWIELGNGTNGTYTITIEDTDFAYGYVYIKATDKDGNNSYMISNQYKIDNQAPKITHTPTGRREDAYSVVCTDDYFTSIEVTVTDNVDENPSIMVNGGKVDPSKNQDAKTLGLIGVSTRNGKIYLEKPGEDDRERDDDGKVIGPIPDFKIYTITARDAAGNTATRLMNVYTQHEWEKNEDGSYKIQDGKEPTATEPGMLSHVNCKHCSRYILVNKDHQWIKIDTENIQDMEQIRINIGSVLVKDGERIYYASPTVNGAIDEAISTYTNKENGIATVIKLTPNTVGAKVAIDESITSLSVPSAQYPLILDLNGQSIDKDGVAYENVTGNAQVTVLLTDNGLMPYANKSQVTGSPIKYVRNITSVQANNWQALCVPFQVSSNGNFEIAEYGKTNTFEGGANGEVVMSLRPTNTGDAYKPMFIKAPAGELVITSSFPLKGTKSCEELSVPTDEFTFYGTMYDSPVSEKNNPFWVMLNNGTMWWASAGLTQRPYRWVVIPQNAKSFSFVFDENDLTGIEDAATTSTTANRIYTLDGRRLNSLDNVQPGIYIVNGQKIQIK